ncbi:MAG: hypothetical protein R6U04_12105 [Bacteroidales bacterium]
MNKTYIFLLSKVFLIAFFLLAIASCKKEKKDTQEKKSLEEESIDTSSVLLKYNETVFTLPSPYQASIAIKEKDIEFNDQLLAPLQNSQNFNTRFKQALNIGVYGADLGYLNLYDQHPECLAYLSVIKKLGENLGLDNAISSEKMNKLERYIDAQDSLLIFLANIYRDFDQYLTNNRRKEIGALIIAGGWIESIYILSQTIKNHENRDLINRLGEQKRPLDNLIELLSSYYYNSDRYTHLIDNLVDLAYEFDGIIYNYYYEKPEVLTDKNLTIVNSKSNVVISEYHLTTITEKITNLRQKIIQ